MSAFHDDLDSDMSDNEEGQDVTGWLDEEDEEVEQPKKAPPIQEDLKQEIDMMLKPAYIIKNSDLFYAMCELEDLEFESMPDEQQEIYMRSLIVETYQPGECIIREGDVGNDLYFVVATQDTNRVAEVEVIQNQDSGQEQFLTKLRRGQYFGQKFFLTRKMNKRGATVRVPKDSPIAVDVARLTPEHFDKWAQFRYVLLAKAVPLIQKLPRKERSQILLSLQVREYRGGDYIVHQGEIGEEFFIIQEGEVKVVETRPSPENPAVMIDVPLVTLREGNVFGEMSLVTNEPRVANVISVGNSICLSLSKSVFRSALSDESFREIVDEVLSKRKVIREQRKTKDEEIMAPSLGDSGKSASTMSGMRKMSMRARSKSLGPGNDVNITSTLSMKKLDSGFRVINQYIIERELGKGSFGDVYLVRDQDTDEQYAMKIIQRPAQNSWNEDAANSIRQEIAVMKRMKHHNVVALREVIDDQSQRKIYLIQEFMEKGALMPDAETCDPIHVETARTYFRDILRGVCYLHSEGIIHRDIKPQNMLLSGDGTVKIADFGAAVFTGAQQKVAFGGTPLFMAPELYRPATSGGAKVDFTKSPGIDVFALGATLYYMLMGRPPWVANTPIELAKQITDIELQFPVAVDPSVRHLLKQMLKKDPRTRCKLDDIVMDEWVTLEGSEPLFEKDETFIDNYTDFGAYIAADDVNAFNPSLRILLVHESLVIRTMLHNQLNLQHTALTAGAASGERAVQIIQQVQKHPIYGAHNFDFIFVDILPLDAKTGAPQKHIGLETVAALKATGFQGKIIGMNGTSGALSVDDVALETEFVAAGCFSVVKRPIANRELAMLLTRSTSGSAEDHAKRVSAEEFEAAITVSRSNAMQRLTSESRKTSTTESQMDLSIISGADTGYSSPVQTHHHLNNIQHEGSAASLLHSGSMSSTAGSPSHHNGNGNASSSMPTADKTENDVDIAMDFTLNDLLDFDVCRRESTPAPTAKPVPRKSLVRKGGFMALKGSNSDLIFDDDAHQPVKIFSLKDSNTKDEMKKRAERRAMMRSQALQQYREAKKVGDEPRTKSMLNILKQSSRKSMFERKKSTRTSSSESTKSLQNVKSVMLGANSNNNAINSPFDTPSSTGSAKHQQHSGSTAHQQWPLSPQQMAMTRLEDVFIEEIHNEDDNFDSDDNNDHPANKRGNKRNKARKGKKAKGSDSDDDDLMGGRDSDLDDDDLEGSDEDSDDDGSIEESSSEEDDDLGNLDAEIMELDDQAMSDLFDTLVLKKDGKEQDMREWDHTIFGVNLARTLTVSHPERYSADLHVKFGVAEAQGCRNYMEDRIYAKAVEASRVAEGLPPLGIFAVFDGHGGDAVAQYLQSRYASVFSSAYRHLETHLDFTQIDPESGIYEAAVARAFEETAARIDRSLLEKDYARQQKQQAGALTNAATVSSLVSSSSNEAAFAGSVGVIAVVAPAKVVSAGEGDGSGRRAMQVFISHVGDCRAVLSQDGVAKALTEDHKASNKAEKARVECAGGFVQNGRVNGALMVSRSFGDIQHKNFALCVGHKGHESESGGIWAECQSVISRPDFTHFLVFNDSFEFIILASDGLWDVFENQEAVNFVRKRLLTNKDLEKTAEELVQKALQRGSQDNTSAIIVAFNQ